MTEATPTRPGSSPDPEAREKILAIAGRLLDEGGYDGLTIRKLASESGFTPPAIYSLFGDKAALVDALIEKAFAGLVERLRNLEKSTDARVGARRALGEVMRFGRAHHWHFRLLEERSPEDGTLDSVEETREILRGPLAALAGSKGLKEMDIEVVRQAFWALLHGLITLPPMRPDVAWHDNLADVAFEAMFEGLLGSGKRGESGQ